MIKLQQVGGMFTMISDKELERRRSSAQRIMRDKGADCVLTVAFNTAQGSGVRYFADFPANDYGSAVILPAEGGLTYIAQGGYGKPAITPTSARGFDENIAIPYAPAFPYSNHLLSEEIVKCMKRRGFRRIGLYRKQFISYLIMDALKEQIDAVEFIPLDEEIDLLMAVKSEEEIKIFADVAKVHDNIYSCLDVIVKPGKTERQIGNEIKKIALDQYFEDMNIMVGAGNPMARHKWYLDQNGLVKDGDYLDILVECQGPGGFFSEVSRMWSLGEPREDLKQAFSDVVLIQEKLAAMAKPGVPACELMKELHRFQVSHGYELESRLCGHSQGYDVVNRPNLSLYETMSFQKNMYISIHPCLGNDNIFAMVTDNFLITEDGAKQFTKTPKVIHLL